MNRRLLHWAAALLAAGAARAASAPEWAMAAAAVPVPPAQTLAIVADSLRVVYISADHTQRVHRYAVRLNRAEDRAVLRFTLGYDPAIDRVTGTRAWIIGPDGRSRAFGQGDFLDASGSNEMIWTTNRVLAFDGTGRVPVGGTLACEVETEQPSTVYEAMDSFQTALYTVEKDFEVVPPPGYSLLWHVGSPSIPAPKAIAEPGGLRWEMRGLRPNRVEQDPSEFVPNPMLVSARPEAGGAIGSWEEMSRRLDAVMAPRAVQTPEIAAIAARLTAGKADRWERIRALTEFVQRDVVYLELTLDTDCFYGFRPHAAAEVLSNRYGDCKDKATLLVALLRAAGEDGRLLVLYSGDPQVVSRDWPSICSFNHAIVAIANDTGAPADWPRLGGEDAPRMIPFDPTDSVTPLGLLSDHDQGGWALLVDPVAGRAVRLPLAEGESHRIDATADAAVDDNGVLTAAVDCRYSGLPAAVRYTWRRSVNADEAKRVMAVAFESTAPEILDFSLSDQWAPKAASYDMAIQFRAAHFSRLLGADLIELRPHILPELTVLAAWQTRTEGVSWFSSATTLRERARIKLPAGCTVEEFPADWDKHGSLVTCRIHYGLEQGALAYESEFSVRSGLYGRDQYEAIRLFFEKFREARRRPVLLRRTAAPGAAHS